MQDILKYVQNLCNKYCLLVHVDPSNSMYLRDKCIMCTKFNFRFDHNELAIVNQYKHFCIILQNKI